MSKFLGCVCMSLCVMLGNAIFWFCVLLSFILLLCAMLSYVVLFYNFRRKICIHKNVLKEKVSKRNMFFVIS